MKTITRLKREPLLFAAIVNRLKEMLVKDETVRGVLLNFEIHPTQNIMMDAGYDPQRRESGVLILAALDDLVDKKCVVVGTDGYGQTTYRIAA